MYKSTIDGRVYIGVSFDLTSFPNMIESFYSDFNKTQEIENLYKDLINTPLTSFDLIAEFIKEVCKWGHYAGISGKVIKNNSPDKILSVFEDTRNVLSQDEPDLALALSKLNTLYGLGTPSFASKHLRFLRPSECPVYDSILSNVLPYSFDPSGYAQFSKDAKKISQELTKKQGYSVLYLHI